MTTLWPGEEGTWEIGAQSLSFLAFQSSANACQRSGSLDAAFYKMSPFSQEAEQGRKEWKIIKIVTRTKLALSLMWVCSKLNVNQGCFLIENWSLL